MLLVKHGDREAFSVLVQRYRKPLINFVYRFTLNPAEAEDLAQEVLIKVFQSAARYEPKAAFSTWLYRIATNLTLNHLRDNKPQFSLSMSGGADGSDDSPALELKDPGQLAEDRLIERERVSQIRKALAALPENQRLALVLTKYQGLSLKQVSEVMKSSESAVKSLIFRAYSSLRGELAPLVLDRK